MLSQARTHAALPVADLGRARGFYEGILGLVPFEVTPAGVLYGTAEGTRFLVFPSSGRSSGTHTQIGFTVSDIKAEVADLKRRGVTFEAYEMPGFDRTTSIATQPTGLAAWFKDTEGNLLGIIQFARPA
jgi:predicted enzyme related to lactoylglutathione lyase